MYPLIDSSCPCHSHVSANAFQATHILGAGRERPCNDKSFESELRRRHFWACYLTDCHAGDSAFSYFSSENTKDLSLPWREEDFEVCQLSRPLVSLGSGETNGGMYCEMVKALTLWYVCSLNRAGCSGDCVKGQQYTTSSKLQNPVLPRESQPYTRSTLKSPNGGQRSRLTSRCRQKI